MDEQTDRRFQLEKAVARQKALKESISQELELYREEISEDKPEESEKKEELKKQIVDTRVMIEDARQRIAYNIKRLSKDFKIEVDIRGYIEKHPRKTLALALAAGFYLGLRK